jgi:hypothetical protein
MIAFVLGGANQPPFFCVSGRSTAISLHVVKSATLWYCTYKVCINRYSQGAATVLFLKSSRPIVVQQPEIVLEKMFFYPISF